MTTSASEIFDLRNFYFYQCGNIFTGSLNNFNYKIIPDKENLTVLVWHGRLCSDLAVCVIYLYFERSMMLYEKKREK